MKLDLKSYEEKKLNMFFYSTEAIPGNTWQYFAIHCDIWQDFYNTSKYFKYLQSPNSTWQTLYQLVSPGINTASIFDANMNTVSWRHCHNTVLVVFCLSGIITVPILMIFPKNFDAYIYCTAGIGKISKSF